MKYLDFVRQRRSYYMLDDKVDIGNEELKKLVGEAITLTPSPFNMQSARAILLLDDESKKFWDKVNGTFDNSIDEAKFKGFHGAKGTVLIFIDQKTVKDLGEKFPAYAENFVKWANHENGMFQTNLWVALRSEGLGASLQHYNPPIDEWVKKDYDVDENWELIAQMPFGNPLEEPAEKDKVPTDVRVKVFE